jgi:excisionase family DNA binding protein
MEKAVRITVTADDLLPVVDAARYLGIHRMTLWRWRQRGKIRPMMVGGRQFFSIKDLDAIRESLSSREQNGE